jgi:hypothetical protein
MTFYGLALPVLIGFGSLATDTGLWYANQRTAQAVADSAAIAAALDTVRGLDEATAIQSAQEDAEKNGFNTAHGVLTINIPASAGPFKDQDGTVEAVVEMEVPNFLAAVVFGDETAVAARSVARTRPSEKCVWVLDPALDGALTYQGSAVIDLDCGIGVKSTHPEAVKNTSNGCLYATEIEIAGGYNASCINPTPLTGVSTQAIFDPLTYLPPPSFDSCDYDSITYNANAIMSPGVYCGSIRLNSTADVTMEPGIYVFDNGAEFRVNGGAILTGNGIMIYFSDDAGRVFLAGGSTIDLSAHSSGPYEGIMFFMDRNGDPLSIHKLTGGEGMHIDGTVYAPTQTLHFSGGSGTESVNAMLIARELAFTGNGNIALQQSTIIPVALRDPVLIE